MKNFLSHYFEKFKQAPGQLFNFRLFLGIVLLLLQFLGFQNCGQSSFKVTDVNTSSVSEPNTLGEGNAGTQFSISLSATPVAITNSGSHTFELQSSEADVVYRCRLNEETEYKDCGGSRFAISNLIDRQHQIIIQGFTSDKTSNVISYSWIQDRLPGRLNFNLPPPSVIAESQVQIQFIATDDLSGVASIECSLDSSTWSMCQSPLSLSNLSSGNHQIAIRTIDKAGNRSAEISREFIANPNLPNVRFLSSIPAFTNQPTASFTFEAKDGLGTEITNIKCTLDGGVLGVCRSPLSLTVSEGTHVLVLQVVDGFGRLASAEMTWAYDATPPSITIARDQLIGGYLTRRTATSFRFSVVDDTSGVSSILCNFDSAPPTPCFNSLAFPQLPLGSHTFNVRATDFVGNHASAQVAFQLLQFPIGIESNSESLGRLASPTRLAEDAEGNILVVDTVNYRIQKFSPQGTPIKSIGHFGKAGDSGVFEGRPSDVVIGPNSEILVAIITNKIKKLNSQGEQISQITQEHEAIAVDSKGNIYVLNQDKIIKLNPNGDVLLTFAGSGSANGQLRSAIDIDVNDQDQILVLDRGNNRVQIFDSNGSFVSKFTVLGPELVGTPSLLSLSVNSSGNIFIADGYRILKFNSSGEFLLASERQNGQIFGIVATNSFIYASVNEDDNIVKLSLDLVPMGSFGSFGYDDGRLLYPGPIAVGPMGSIFVGDSLTRGIKWYNSFGEMQYGQQHKVLGAAKFDNLRGGSNSSFIRGNPIGLAVDGSNRVYVSDTSSTIKRVSPIDYSLLEFGGTGAGDGKFGGLIYYLAVCNNKSVYAIDNVNYRVQKFSLDGEFQLKFGSRGQTNGKFESPSGIACDPSGNVFVLDRADSRIQKFSPQGVFIEKYGGRGYADNQFWQAEDIAIDSEGNMYVLDSSAGTYIVVKLNSSGTFVKKYVLSGLKDRPNRIAIHNSGGILVSDLDRVVLFAP